MVLLVRTYDPFHVTMSEKEPGICLVKAKSKIGDAETQTKLPFTEEALKEKLHRFALMAEGKATPAKDELREFGQELDKMLFHDAVWELFKKATSAAEHAEGVLIELDIQSLKLSQIPWELLHDETDFLALSRRTPLIRSVSQPEGEVKPIELPLRILFAAAKPLGEAPLNIGRQIRQVCESLRKAMQEGAVELHPALGEEVQSNSFLETLRVGGYHVLHITTHGAFVEELDRGFVLLQDGMGEAAPLAINTLAGMIRDTSIQLICLEACETAAGSSLSGNLLRSGANAALAMRFPIREDLAARFFGVFYQCLMKGDPIWCSIVEARIALRDPLGRDTIDWAIPSLYLRDGYTPAITGTVQPLKRCYTPRAPARFVGREPQLDELTEKLLQPSTRSVVVHGFGGIGKSTLIEKLLSEMYLLFQDTCHVDCRGISDVLAAIPQINSMLSVHGLPLVDSTLSGLSESGKIEYLTRQLDKGKFLVALDNIDEMQGKPLTRVFFDLVDHSANIKILASCRIPDSPLGHQRQQRIDALEERHAMSLIREVGHDIPQIPSASDFDLRRINEKLRGHPLSIVIAIPYFETESFESALEDLPTRVGSDAEIAQGILDWSYGKLSPEEQRFLENASVFYGQVPMQALLDINDGKDRDILAKLVRKNMIEFDQIQLYSLHPMLREYAYAKLAGRRDEVQIKAAMKIAPRLPDVLWAEALILYEAGVESGRRSKNQAVLCVLLLRLGYAYYAIGEYSKAQRCQEESLRIGQHLKSDSMASSAMHALGMIEQDRGNYDEAKKLYNESLAIKRKLGDQSAIATTVHNLAAIEQDRGNYDEAKELYDQSLEIKRKLGNQSGIASTLHQLAVIEHDKGNYNEAKKLYNEAKATFEKLGDQSAIAATVHNLAAIEQDRGNYDEAKKLYNESLVIKRKLGDQHGIAPTLHQLAMIEQAKGNHDEARKLYNQSLEIKRKLGDQHGIAATLHHLGMIEQDNGNYDEAKNLYNQSLEIDRKLGNQSGTARSLGQLATIEQTRGNHDEAKRLYDEAKATFEKLGDQSGIAMASGSLGRLYEEQGDLEAAEKYYGQALEIFEKLGEKPNIDLARRALECVRKLKRKKP